MKHKRYLGILRSIHFTQAACCPDLTNILSRFIQNPGRPHWNALIHLVRYIIGTKLVITYYHDAPGGPTFWMSKHQDVVALSTTEAEYIALAKEALEQARRTHNFLAGIRHPQPNHSLSDRNHVQTIDVPLPSVIIRSCTLESNTSIFDFTTFH
jgi:hypothetical protein